MRLQGSLDELEETSADVALLFWILAILFFSLGDTVSSFMVFSQGGNEPNPIMRWSLGLLPDGLLGFVLVKTAAISILYAIAFLWKGAHRWMIPIVLILAGVYLTNNMLVFLDIR